MADHPVTELRSPSASRQERMERRRRIVAFAWLAAFLVLVLGLWGVAVSQSTSGDTGSSDVPLAADASPAPEGADGSGSDSTGDGADDEPGADDEAGSEDETTEGDDDPAADAQSPAGLETVVLDDICTVVVVAPVDGEEATEPRPWDYDACTYAPIEVEEHRARWIVVRASLSAADFTPGEAEVRARELDAEDRVLWSSHYPSLNPDLWVVYDGPFPNGDAARDAAVELADGAYARALTTDEGDRFCNAQDGCVGERTD